MGNSVTWLILSTLRGLGIKIFVSLFLKNKQSEFLAFGKMIFYFLRQLDSEKGFVQSEACV